MMDLFYYEIVHTEAGRPTAEKVRALIAGEPLLVQHSAPWPHRTIPANATLYTLVVIVSDDLAHDHDLRRRITEVAARGFPVLPIVENVAGTDWTDPVLGQRNGLELGATDDIIRSLLHHGGLRPFGSEGQVMISYARSDGHELALALRERLQQAGFRCRLDERDIAGGSEIQARIQDMIRESDLVLLVDSKGASQSRWVAEEMDMAWAAHVPVLAITPTVDGAHYEFHTPHVDWETGCTLKDIADRAANRVRLFVARKIAFKDRVRRALEQLCKLRGWPLRDEAAHLLIEIDAKQTLRVACAEVSTMMAAIIALRKRIGTHGRGLLVGGTRPYPRPQAEALADLGGSTIRVTPLSCVATRVVDGIVANALAGRRIFLSAAMPDDREQAALVLPNFIVTFVQTMFELGATVVYGGHPSVTPLMHKSVVDLVRPDTGKIELHQGKYWRKTKQLPSLDKGVFKDVRWWGEGSDPAADITALRDGMITATLDAAVFVGGVERNPVGGRPGIVDEYWRFRAACPSKPAFVLGLADGAAASLLASGEPPDHLLDPIIVQELADTRDPDLATALMVAELLHPSRARPG